jgi:hypothetical protein
MPQMGFSNVLIMGLCAPNPQEGMCRRHPLHPSASPSDSFGYELFLKKRRLQSFCGAFFELASLKQIEGDKFYQTI